jgi:hypothetical protein
VKPTVILASLLAACGIAPAEQQEAEDLLTRAFETRASNLQVQGTGTVIRILRDDRDGARHQRFLLRLRSGQTLLVAHNIDVAPRVPVEEGDGVGFNGEYEWNEQGGVLHWTHRADRGDHADGWLEHRGRRYD